MLELSDKIKQHFWNPLNVGEMENPEGMGSIENPVCGDITHLYLRVHHGVIEDAKFLSFGCAVTIASASVFTEKIKGKKIDEVFEGSDHEVIQRLIEMIEGELGEIPPVKLHCPPATVQVFLEAISQYLSKIGDIERSSRARRLIPQISEFYRRGETTG